VTGASQVDLEGQWDTGLGKEVTFYSLCLGKPLKDFKQEYSNQIVFLFCLGLVLRQRPVLLRLDLSLWSSCLLSSWNGGLVLWCSALGLLLV
jgi:hypothetical protein